MALVDCGAKRVDSGHFRMVDSPGELVALLAAWSFEVWLTLSFGSVVGSVVFRLRGLAYVALLAALSFGSVVALLAMSGPTRSTRLANGCALGSECQYSSDLKMRVPYSGMRRVGARELPNALSFHGQVERPASMHTDASLGNAAIGNQPPELAFGSCDAQRSLLPRSEGLRRS